MALADQDPGSVRWDEGKGERHASDLPTDAALRAALAGHAGSAGAVFHEPHRTKQD